MDLLVTTISIKVCSTFAISLVYLYLYVHYRERYMGFWSLSWLLFSIHLLLDLLRFKGFDSATFLLINQIFSVLSVVFLIQGAYCFIGKKINKLWFYSAVAATILSDIALLLNFSFTIAAIPTAFYFGIVDAWTGILFLKFWKIKGMGKQITGYALLLLGALNSLYPFFTATNTPYAAAVFFIGTILELSIILATLIVYFQRIRTELSESEKRFRLLADNAKDIIYRFSYFPNKRFDYVSPAVTNLTGFTPEDFYKDANNVLRIVSPSDIKIYSDFINEPHKFQSPLILRITTKEGKEIWTEQHFVPIYDKDNRLFCIEGIVRDITERKNMEIEFLKLDRLHLVGEMAAGIGHEIRNPMQVVRGFLQILSEKNLYQQDKEYFNIMIDELDRANGIISEYLSMAKNKAIDLKEQNINKILNAVHPLLQAEALMSDKNVILDLNSHSEILADEKEIRQLVINLAKNGLESMGSGNRLLLQTQEKNGNLILSVADTGTGIPQNVVDKLGTPFFSTKDSGVGLGLAICYSIAERHKAKISFNTSPTGTTFFVEFKIVD